MTFSEIGEDFSPREQESANANGIEMMKSQNLPKSWDHCNKPGIEPRFTKTRARYLIKLSEHTCSYGVKSYTNL